MALFSPCLTIEFSHILFCNYPKSQSQILIVRKIFGFFFGGNASERNGSIVCESCDRLTYQRVGGTTDRLTEGHG